MFDFDGNLLRKIRKENKAVLLSDKDREEYEQLLQNYPPNLRDKFFIPDSYPPYQRIIPFDEKCLFVQTHEEPSEGHFIYNIFNTEGVFTARVELEGFQMKLRGERLYCLREKDSGYKELNVYKMIWE